MKDIFMPEETGSRVFFKVIFKMPSCLPARRGKKYYVEL
jgi:hypothetical protein